MTNMITKITSIAAAAAIITAAIPTAEYLTGTSITSVTASAAAVNTLTLSDLDRIEREWESHPYVLSAWFWANYTSSGKVAVGDLQELLAFDFGFDIDIDSVFGYDTENYVKEGQRRLSITVDGKVGNTTFYCLIDKARSIINERGQSSTVSNTNSKIESSISWMEYRQGWNKDDMGYKYDWCTAALCDAMIDSGYDICRTWNTCDFVIDICDNHGMGTFYCFRNANYQSLKNNGMSKSGFNHVIKTSRSDFTPQRGDIVVYRWSDDFGYNWSHIGIITNYSNGTLYTIDANTSGGKVAKRTRSYNSEVVGILRM